MSAFGTGSKFTQVLNFTGSLLTYFLLLPFNLSRCFNAVLPGKSELLCGAPIMNVKFTNTIKRHLCTLRNLAGADCMHRVFSYVHPCAIQLYYTCKNQPRAVQNILTYRLF